MKTHICICFSAAVAFVVALLLLQAEYPWSTYAAFNFSKGKTLVTYMLAAAVIAATAAAATAFCLGAFKRSLLLSAVMCGVATFVPLALIAFLLGPAGLEVPGTRLNGIFFSEWKFLNFLFMVAAPVSIVGAALCGWLGRKRSDASLKSPD